MPRGALEVDNRNVPAGMKTIYIPGAFLLSATHNLSPSLSCSQPPGLVLPPLPTFLILFLSLRSLLDTWHIACLLSMSASYFAFPPLCFCLLVFLCLYPLSCLHSLVSSLSLCNSLWEHSSHSCVFFQLADYSPCSPCPALIGLSRQTSHTVDLKIQ